MPTRLNKRFKCNFLLIVHRSTALGILSAAFALGIVCSSFLSCLSQSRVIECCCYGSLAVASVIIMILPETLHRPTPDVPEECEPHNHVELENSVSDLTTSVTRSEGINFDRVEIIQQHTKVSCHLT